LTYVNTYHIVRYRSLVFNSVVYLSDPMHSSVVVQCCSLCRTLSFLVVDTDLLFIFFRVCASHVGRKSYCF